ncbi:MAG: Mth938-like domain-containing protein [bacterium]
MIDSYRFGEIVIDGERYTSDVIIYPDRVDANWWRKEGHRLSVGDLKGIVETRPEVLVVGTGDAGVMEVPVETKEYLEAGGIKLITERTGQACQTFNRLVGSGNVIAALHLTC